MDLSPPLDDVGMWEKLIKRLILVSYCRTNRLTQSEPSLKENIYNNFSPWNRIGFSFHPRHSSAATWSKRRTSRVNCARGAQAMLREILLKEQVPIRGASWRYTRGPFWQASKSTSLKPMDIKKYEKCTFSKRLHLRWQGDGCSWSPKRTLSKGFWHKKSAKGICFGGESMLRRSNGTSHEALSCWALWLFGGLFGFGRRVYRCLMVL